ncbi:SKP protein 9 [Spatholobus suberectus]|nr:SKP protein 9 [Spatholobus suberectus]
MEEETKPSNTATLNTAEGEEPKKIKLKTADEVIFEVEPYIVKEMETVQSFIDINGGDASSVIPLPNVRSRELGRIVEYSSEHRRGGSAGKLREFDERFVMAMSSEELRQLLSAMNYLNMDSLLYSSIADIIKGKSVEFVRNFFGIVNDYTPEEEARIREANAWVFEGAQDD